MTISTSGSASLDMISSSYQSKDTTTEENEDYLGRETFLTMLVAQLENQDPLNPMEGTDFSSQLAQFSQLEQLMNLNETMEDLSQTFVDSSEADLMSYMGKQVTGDLDTMQVSSGEVSGGYFNLTNAADVIVQITDSSGQTVKSINMGTMDTGSQLISWDGTDDTGEAVEDGTYTYSVMANTGSGYTQIDNSVTGTAEEVVYTNGKGYLVVQGLLIDPEKISLVQDVNEEEADADSAMNYLGKTVESNEPIIRVDEGVVSGTDLSFDLETSEAATVNVYDPFNNLVRTMAVDASATFGGDNSIHWDAVDDNGSQVDDGLYYYTVTSESGTATTPVKEEVSGIRNANGLQYLELADSGRLLSVSSIKAVGN